MFGESAHCATQGGIRLHRTVTTLADGRELIYFDDAAGAKRNTADRRTLDRITGRSHLRRDRVLDEWVVMAAHRQTRTHLPSADECPLCPSASDRLTEIPGEYDVVVFENRFPSLHSAAHFEQAREPARRPAGVGRCEVVAFTAEHGASFADLSPTRMATVYDAWSDRTLALSALPGVEYVFVFENRGEDIGVTLHHPHGQIYGYPFIPPKVARGLESARKHRETHGDCLFCDIVKEELAGDRLVAKTTNFVAFVPEAAHWPYEVHVYPTRHLPDLPSLSASERGEVAALQADILTRFDKLFAETSMPYIQAWSQAPVNADRDLAHLRLEIFSARRAPAKLKYLAGSEAAAGVFINDVLPELAAEQLRAAAPRAAFDSSQRELILVSPRVGR